MKRLHRILTVLVLCLTVAAARGQENPVRWKGSAEDKGDGHYTLVMTAAIADGWHMYDLGPYEGGPNATTIKFTAEEGVSLDGELVQKTESKRVFDRMFGMEIGYFEHKAVFEQTVTLSAPAAVVKAEIEYMVCDDRSCVPPTEVELVFELANKTAAADAPKEQTANKETASAVTEEQEAVADAAEKQAAEPETVADAAKKQAAEPEAVAEATDAESDGGSMWGLVIEAILWGFAALLTPCVFPMVPMTVSFFMKGSSSPAKGRFNASLYGFFIVALYTLPIAAIIVITRILGGDAVTADIFNFLATHWLPNLVFFAVFMIFAASFFGAFEITMPSSLVNKSDAQSDKGGIGGIFFMALTLVLVSFSCTGPIVGSVLIKSTAGEFWNPIITMFAFSAAFALPFTLFAFFPSMLKRLPKSGGWLNSVKVVLGFVEVALGFKFLSVADQTYHWGLLDREVYLAIWIAVFALLGLYLLGKIKFAHDSDLPYLGVGRLALAIAVFSFVVYLIPGMWGAPLKALSGYLPPLTSQDFVITRSAAAVQPSVSNDDAGKPKYSDFLHLPHGLEGFFDLKEAEAYAAKVNKPLFIDFTGHGCVNCREMEARVWADPTVLSILRDNYVIVALYTDDKKELPESDWVTTDTGKVLKTLGKINSYYALKRFGVNAQPYYVLQGRDGKVLVEPRGYDLDAAAFAAFLRSGLEAYRNEAR